MNTMQAFQNDAIGNEHLTVEGASGLFRTMSVSNLDSGFGSDMAAPVDQDARSPLPSEKRRNKGLTDKHTALIKKSSPTRRQPTRARSASSSFSEKPRDELRSRLYSDTIETLRDQLVERFPELDAMISQAVIHAFSPSEKIASRTFEKKPHRHQRRRSLNPEEDMVQQILDAVFIRVKKGKITTEAAIEQITNDLAIWGVGLAQKVNLDVPSLDEKSEESVSWGKRIEASAVKESPSNENRLDDIPHLMASLSEFDIGFDTTLLDPENHH